MEDRLSRQANVRGCFAGKECQWIHRLLSRLIFLTCTYTSQKARNAPPVTPITVAHGLVSYTLSMITPITVPPTDGTNKRSVVSATVLNNKRTVERDGAGAGSSFGCCV